MAQERLEPDFLALSKALEAGGEERTDSLSSLNIFMEDPRFPLAEKGAMLRSNIPMALLFGCLETDSQSEIDSCCSLLRKVLDSMPRRELIDPELVPYFQLGLNHPNERVRELALMEILRCTEGDAELGQLRDNGLLKLALEKMSDASLSVAKIACHMMAQLPYTQTGLGCIADPMFVEEIKDLMSRGAETRFRMYESLLGAATVNEQSLLAISQAGLLDGLATDLKSQDPLVRVNVLQIFSTMTANPSTYRYLVQSGTLDTIAVLLKDTADPWAPLCVPFIIRFYGKLADVDEVDYKQLFNQYSLYAPFVHALRDSDPVLAECTLLCLSQMARVKSGVKTLISSPPLRENMFSHIGRSVADLRTAALNACAVLFSNSDQEFEGYLAGMFNDLPGQPNVVDLLYGLIRQPFQETRNAAYHLLRSLATHPWGAN
eukprot:Ihof_evm3s15 gene=Ihof_evmTU3s15